MAWTSPITFVANTPLTAQQLNENLRDNFMVSEVAIASEPQGLIFATDLNTLVERVGSSDIIDTSETTTSTSYVDLDTVGPTVTVTTGTRALLLFSCQFQSDTTGCTMLMSIDISGNTTIAAADTGALQLDGILEDKTNRMSLCNFVDELTPGENTFTAKYRTSGPNGTFSDRNLTVIPF